MESSLETSLRKAIAKRGGLALKLTSLSFTGLPDRLILLPGGKVIFLETKGVEKKPRVRQLVVQRQLEALGFRVWNIWTREHMKLFLFSLDADISSL